MLPTRPTLHVHPLLSFFLLISLKRWELSGEQCACLWVLPMSKVIEGWELEASALWGKVWTSVSLSCACRKEVSSPEEPEVSAGPFSRPWDQGHGLWIGCWLSASPHRLQEAGLAPSITLLLKSSPAPSPLTWAALPGGNHSLYPQCRRSNTGLVVGVNSGQAFLHNSEFPRFCQCKPDS